MSASQTAHKERTFRSGPYLSGLMRSAERMDAQLQSEICARIKQARVESGFTQEDAAELLGVTMRGYQNYESVRVPFRKLTRIAEMFRVQEAWLLHGEMEQLPDRLESLEGKADEILDLLARASAATDARMTALEQLLQSLLDQGRSAADG